MRWLPALTLLVVVAPPAAAQDIGAAKLFRGVEKKVRAAKTLRIRFDWSQITPKESKTSKIKGTLLLGEGDLFRLEFEGKLSDEPVNGIIVSDGVKMST